MQLKRQVWLGFVAAIAALFAGQAGAQDWPTLQGANSRVGRNANPQIYGPGFAGLVWFQPNGPNRPVASLRNNTSNQVTKANALVVNYGWKSPTPDQEAGFPYQQPRTLDPVYNLILGTNQFPAYQYARSTPSQLNGADGTRYPTQAAAPNNLSTFTWTIDPTLDYNPVQAVNYQLYVWLPNGPTLTPFGNYVYPNRYFAYTITFGTGQVWTEVIDRNVAGQGWVRLGKGGLPTNTVFPYDGTNPIRITLYNTQVRDENNNVLEDPATNPCVYADAVMAIPDTGSYTASPTVRQTVGTQFPARTQVVTARNNNQSASENGQMETVTAPEVAAYPWNGLGPNLNAPTWKWSPLEVSPNSTMVDNQQAQFDLLWTASTLTNHIGADYLKAVLQPDPNAVDMVTYSPTLDDGDYLVQVYVGGNSGGEIFGQQTTIYVYEGATVTTYAVDQTVPGWVTIGSRRFLHRGSIGENLKVGISNYSPLPADVGKLAFADSVRFVGAFNEQVNATPAQAQVNLRLANGTIAPRDVVVVASDDGHIYCLDAEGNNNGTTSVYWVYPSIEPNGTSDPNQVPGEDGLGPIADMPTSSGFGMSSPLIERVNGKDYCYIAARNGRVYCIDMEGRGDYDFATNKLGTTKRMWSYPDDYPAFKRPALPLGDNGTAFGGSIAYAVTTQGPTVFVPAMEGRMYALDATTGGTKTTTARWTYPQLTDPTLGPVTTTPAVDFDSVFFGTARKTDGDPGQFYSLDMDDGSFKWVFEGDPLGTQADNFRGGPCTATSLQLGIANNMVYCSNDNLFVYGLDADNGTMLWNTAELNSTVTGALSFTWMNVYNLGGVLTPYPVVMVPTDIGSFEGLFARPADVNIDNLKQAFGYIAGADSVVSSMAIGWNFMYGTDTSGNLYAFGNAPTVGGMGSPPGTEEVVSNNPISQLFREAKIISITKSTYTQLRDSDLVLDPSGDTGMLTQPQALAGASNRTAFEWGETAYFLVYDFPFAVQDQNGDPVAPPVVNFQIAVEGSAVRQFGIQAKKFKVPPVPANGEGYAVLAFPIQGSGSQTIPPGSVTMKFSFTSAAGGTNGQPVQFPGTKTWTFTVANPLGIATPDPNTGLIGGANRQYGTNTDPSAAERNVNGSPGAKGRQLGQSEGVVSDGQTGTGDFWVVDMSMMTLLRGPGRGLDQVRMSRPELAWSGGPGAVVKPINQLFYPAYEDLPTNFPNRSLDYPNIGRDALRATKDPNGVAENPIINSVTLIPPTLPVDYDEGDLTTLLNRQTKPVLFQLDVDVPRFQPANNSPSRYFLESGGTSIPSGYLGRLSVFVDSNGNGVHDSVSGRREPSRNLTTNIAVALDERLAVTTPTVDLGSLAQGTAYSPLAPGTDNGLSMSPWWSGAAATYPNGTVLTSNQDYVGLWQPFTVQNIGNVNMLNVRVAKAVSGGPAPGPWPIYSNSVDDLGWLESPLALWSDIDNVFQLGANGTAPPILLQKARVGDSQPSELSTNPIRRYNANLGVLEELLYPTGPTAAAPRVAVSIPPGFPVGAYSQRISVIDDYNNDQAVEVDNANNPLEPLSDPSFVLKFVVREARMTTDFTKATAPMIDYPQAPVNSQNLTWPNLQPAGMRANNGDLLMIHTSSQTGFNAAHPTDVDSNPPYRLYFSTLNNDPNLNVGQSPLRDLYKWTPATTDRWWRQEVGPFPAAGTFDTLFQTLPGETLIGSSVKFGAPALPTSGQINPLGGPSFTTTYFAFVGEAQKQTANGRAAEYRLMAGSLTIGANGEVNVGAVQSMPFDPNTPKGRPSIYQAGNTAVIVYTSSGTGQGQPFFTVFDGTNFTEPQPLTIGTGFENFGPVSAQVRNYVGAGGRKTIVEMAFVGKLRGRSISEVFYGRALANGQGTSPGSSLYLPSRAGEQLVPDGENAYRAQGVVWNTRQPIHVYQFLNGSLVDLEQPNTRSTDRATGLIRFNSKLGGEIYVDPNLGTVRFSASQPLRAAKILLEYTPRYLRINESTVASHASPTVLWDNRLAGDTSAYSYWLDVNSNGSVSNVVPGTAVRSARYVFTYTREASGAGQSARPYWKTERVGVQLPSAIYTDTAGNISGLTITGAGPNAHVQVDPAHGRIYFEAPNEDNVVTISYTGVDEGTGSPIAYGPAPYMVGLVAEKAEAELPVEQAVNESSVAPFLDPFDSPARPGLIWLYFVSTRAGAADVYMEAIAPRFTPVIGGK